MSTRLQPAEPVALPADATPTGAPEDRALCGVLARMRDKWSVLVLLALRDGPLRFGALQRKLERVSHRMLTHTLRALERDGLVSRTVTAVMPPRVDYALTALGRSLNAEIASLDRWAQANQAAIRAAQSEFDQRAA